MRTVRILVADDHEVVRGGLRALLATRPDWEVVGEATTGREVVELAKQLKPDLIVLDITIPKLTGLEATRQILKTLPRIEVLILTMHESEQMAREVLAAGARGYVLKSDAGRELISAVEALCQHKIFLTPRVSELVLQGYLEGRGIPESLEDRLTPREREIIQLVAEGKSNKEVAELLGITVKTTETHRTNLMRKLNLHSVSGLIRFAIRNKLVEP